MTTDDRIEGAEDDGEDESPDRRDFGPAFTPRQIIGGFILLAALIALLRRRRRSSDEGDD